MKSNIIRKPIKSKKTLKWQPKNFIKQLAKEMVQNDLNLLSKND